MSAAQLTPLFFTPTLPEDAAQKRYKALARVLHPDTETGDTTLMQRLNAEFDAYKARTLLPCDTDEYDPRRELAAFILYHLPKFPGVYYVYQLSGSTDLLIIAQGQTFAVKEELKRYGFRWNPAEKCWVLREALK